MKFRFAIVDAIESFSATNFSGSAYLRRAVTFTNIAREHPVCERKVGLRPWRNVRVSQRKDLRALLRTDGIKLYWQVHDFALAVM